MFLQRYSYTSMLAARIPFCHDFLFISQPHQDHMMCSVHYNGSNMLVNDDTHYSPESEHYLTADINELKKSLQISCLALGPYM